MAKRSNVTPPKTKVIFTCLIDNCGPRGIPKEAATEAGIKRHITRVHGYHPNQSNAGNSTLYKAATVDAEYKLNRRVGKGRRGMVRKWGEIEQKKVKR